MTMPRYFSVIAPASWNKSGTTKVTVRTGGAYSVYLCVGNQRLGLNTDEAWALWVAMSNALTTFGPAPDWATEQATTQAVPADRES
ncbi:hypothetical protein AB0395_29745 [Streptosporangium sp. NPDC051023]|uniref:hypothetical protein n=1 Tax=Streptosporangium sp. NPDC051023 TaxID=3155410 RepID=UPI00344E5BAB